MANPFEKLAEGTYGYAACKQFCHCILACRPYRERLPRVLLAIKQPNLDELNDRFRETDWLQLRAWADDFIAKHGQTNKR